MEYPDEAISLNGKSLKISMSDSKCKTFVFKGKKS
jgi:hypothetical protein